MGWEARDGFRVQWPVIYRVWLRLVIGEVGGGGWRVEEEEGEEVEERMKMKKKKNWSCCFCLAKDG